MIQRLDLDEEQLQVVGVCDAGLEPPPTAPSRGLPHTTGSTGGADFPGFFVVKTASDRCSEDLLETLDLDSMPVPDHPGPQEAGMFLRRYCLLYTSDAADE